MQPLSKYNKGNKYLLCAIDLSSKYARVIPIKDKKGTSILNAFQKIISKWRKPTKIWVDQGSEFYNTSFKDFLKINNIEMYSTYDEGKSVVAERSIKLSNLWKTKFTSIWQLFQKILILMFQKIL